MGSEMGGGKALSCTFPERQQQIQPHPEEARSAVSKDGLEFLGACMVRDASLRDAPHHEEKR
jgi:hypothetical protein